MGENPKKQAPTPEELKEIQEEEKFFDGTEDEVRQKIVDEYGLDAEVNTEVIEKIRKKFGKLDGQKRRFRELYQVAEEELKKKPKPEDKPDKDKPEGDDDKKGKSLTAEEFESRLAERDFQNELKSLDCSDELRQQVESYARLNAKDGKLMSPKEAFESSLIKAMKAEEDKKAEEVEAGADGPRRTRPTEISERKPEDLSGEGEVVKSSIKGLDPVNDPEDRKEHIERLQKWQKRNIPR